MPAAPIVGTVRASYGAAIGSFDDGADMTEVVVVHAGSSSSWAKSGEQAMSISRTTWTGGGRYAIVTMCCTGTLLERG